MKAAQSLLASIAALALIAAEVHAEAAGQPGPAAGLTEDECRAVWNTAAGRSDLGADGAKPYIDDFSAVDANHDSKIDNAEFKAGCKAGLVHKFKSPD